MATAAAKHPEGAEPFGRPIAPVEWWFLGHPRSVASTVQLCVEGIGRIDPGALRTAVAEASQACPGARLRRDGQRWVDSGVAPRVRVRTARSGGLPDPGRPLTGLRGRACEVLLLDGPAPTVVFRAAHAVMDARGVLLWAEDIFRALRGEALLGARDAKSYLDVLDRQPEPAEAVADATAEAAEPAQTPVPAASPLGQPRRHRGALWRRRTIDGTFPGLVARLATAITEQSGLATAPFGITVDMRRYDPEIRSTGNFSQSTGFRVTAGEPWETAHVEVLNVLAERRELTTLTSPGVLGVGLPKLRVLIRLMDRGTRKKDQYSTLTTLSHLGRIPLAGLSTDDFEAVSVYSMPTRPPAGPPEINIVECGERTELTLVWWAGADMGRRADALLDSLVEMLSPAAQRIPATSGTERELPDSRNVVARFRQHARDTPDAVAISTPHERISYAELDRRSDVVAAELRAAGVGRDSVVGVLADRTVLGVTGVWGVLKSGAAYLPIDAQHPDGRVRAVLERSPVCLVQRPHHDRDCLPEGCRRIVLDDLPHAPERPVSLAEPEPGDLAYVIYTSGSTGRPKGIELEHGGLTNYASWAVREYRIDSSTRLPLLTSFSFDVACVSTILPLITGGTLLLIDGELSHLALRDVLADRATMLVVTPSHLELISRLNLEPAGVHTVIAGGEQFPRSLALRTREMFGPECRILNLYGPAEATIAVTHHEFDSDADTEAAVPIGRPMDNVRLLLLDEHHRPAEPGELGEIHLGGVQLGRGYRGRPDLTRERFVRLADGSRVYRTGDLARELPNGALVVAGRMDDQVKVNGYRVEPLEIARTLEEHPAVTAAIVVAMIRPGQDGKSLCGYVVAAAGSGEPDPAELTAFVADRLPRYMVPAAILTVAEIPRTVNGKADVLGLPNPFTETGERPGEQPRRDEVEDAVAAIWSRVLKIDADRFDSRTDFHRLGGDSLSLLTMIADVAREVVGPAGEEAFTGRTSEIIRQPTVEWVAELVTKSRAG